MGQRFRATAIDSTVFGSNLTEKLDNIVDSKSFKMGGNFKHLSTGACRIYDGVYIRMSMKFKNLKIKLFSKS